MVKNPLANAGDTRRGFDPWVGDLPNSSILAWRIPWTEEPGIDSLPSKPFEDET